MELVLAVYHLCPYLIYCQFLVSSSSYFMITEDHLYPHPTTKYIICANAYITCGNAPTSYMRKQIKSVVIFTQIMLIESLTICTYCK